MKLFKLSEEKKIIFTTIYLEHITANIFNKISVLNIYPQIQKWNYTLFNNVSLKRSLNFTSFKKYGNKTSYPPNANLIIIIYQILDSKINCFSMS